MQATDPAAQARLAMARCWAGAALAGGLTAAALALWLAGLLADRWAIPLLAAAALTQLPSCLELATVRRLLRRTAPDRTTGGSAWAMLSGLMDRLDALDHRSADRHPVTGLPLREPLFQAIAASAARGESRLLAILRFADHDRIAAFDQPAAHQILTALARRLTEAASADHFVAQVDRDCFAVWFAARADIAGARAELCALLHPLTQEMATSVTTILPAIEVGTATLPDDGGEPALLLLRALAARSRPNVSAAGAISLAHPPVAAARERFVLEQGLAHAIAEEQLTMLFQPLVDVAERRVVGAEALLRWHHPELGPVSPSRFIPLVEATGLSDRYGSWVLNAACREIRRWRDAGLGDLRVAVNLSACQLGDPALRDKIERTLARHRLPPSVLELELTETAAMADMAQTLRLFGELHQLGVSLAIDDFGSGHSSLSYLKNLPFDKLKIDREFVTDVHRQADSQAICRAVIDLGRGLGLRVLAEGVECREEMEALSRLGCTLFQGFYFSRPGGGPDFACLAADPARLPGLGSPHHRQLSTIQGLLSA